MKQRRLVAKGVGVVDHERGFLGSRVGVGGEFVAMEPRGAGMAREDRGEMAFARAFRADDEHQRRRPSRPGVDQRQSGGVGRENQEVLTRETRFVRQRQRQLPRSAHGLSAAGERPR